MDTLYIMGLMEEFDVGRQWIEKELTLNGLVSFTEKKTKNCLSSVQFVVFYVSEYLRISIRDEHPVHRRAADLLRAFR